MAPDIQLKIIRPGRTEPELPDGARDWRRVKKLKVVTKESTAPKATLTLLNHDNRYPDDPMFDVGCVLVLSWGYRPRRMSPPRRFVIQKPGAGVPEFQVAAVGESILMHKVEKVRTWKKVRPSDVVRALAEENGYGPEVQDVDDFGEERETITQPGWTDARLIARICQKESANGVSYVWGVNEHGFFCHAKRLGAAPRRTLVYVGPGAGDFLAFPKFDLKVAQNPGKVTASGVDPVTQKPITATASNDTTTGRPGLATVQLVIDRRTGVKTFQTAAASEVVVATGAKTQKEADSHAQSIFARASYASVVMTAKIIGDPYVVSLVNVAVEGVGRRVGGLYHITEVTDDIQPGKYEQTLKATRDGLNAGPGGGAPVASSSATVNTQKGPEPGQEEGEKLEPSLSIDGKTGEKKTVWKPSAGKA